MTRSYLDRDIVLALRDEAIEANATGIAIVSADPHRHVIEDVNVAFARITGYPASALLGQTLAKLAGPRTRTEDAEAIRQALNVGQTYADTIVAYRADGTPIWVDLSLSPSFASGEVRHVLLTIRDATDLMRAQAALRLNRDLGTAVRSSARPADIIPDVARRMVPIFADWCVIHLLQDDGSLSAATVASASGEIPTGAAAVDVQGEGIGAVAFSSITLTHQPADPHNPALARQVERLLGRPVHAIASVPIASDATHTFGAITWAITADHRQFAREDIEIAEDVGARLGYYFDMYRARENLSSALHSRESFLSQAGHELRTPVVSIRGYAQLLLRDIRRQSLSPQRLENGLRTIESSAARLSQLTEDLFTVYNRGSATVPLSLTTVEAETYLRDFFTSARAHLLHGHDIDLSGIRPNGWISIDVVRFSQVLYNLINNAERFSPPSSPIRVASVRQGNAVLIEIADEGQGLLPGEDNAIFDPFYTSRRRQPDAQAGLGISLYISRQIVQRHQGRIWAESAGPDRGTTFKVLLPEAPAPGS